MAKKNANGEGTITRRADGRWVAAVSLGWQGSRPRRKWLYGKTKKEAAQKLRETLAAQDKGQAIGTRSQTLEQFLRWWLHDVKKGSVRSTTWNSYEVKIRLHINPELGGVQLEKLTTQRIQSFLTMKLESGLAPAMVRSLRVILVSALTKAHELDLVPKNVAAFSAAPHVPKTKVDPLSVDETRTFLGAVGGEPLEALFVVAVTAGLRRGELLGLSWANIDLDKKQIQVRQALQRVERSLQLVPTKSGHGRNVSLSNRRQRRFEAAQETSARTEARCGRDVEQRDGPRVYD